MTNDPPTLHEGPRIVSGAPTAGPPDTPRTDNPDATPVHGPVTRTSVKNLLQRLFVAQRCRDGDRVVDVCCGRGHQVAMLRRHHPGLGSYTGLDISADHLAEARSRVAETPAAFPVTLHRADVAAPWPVPGPFEVAVHTSALHHLPRAQGLASLRHTAESLTGHGRLLLSVPLAPGDPPHRVHTHQWGHDELFRALVETGFTVEDIVGVLPPPDPDTTVATLDEHFGKGGVALYLELERHTPAAVLGPVIATALENAASEAIYVCRKRAPR